MVKMEMNKGLSELVNQLDRMVETISLSPTLKDSELRRVLSFISQVIQVVEQAFQDVLTLLIEIKYLDKIDLATPKINELRMKVDLLTARSFYRDAAEICSRLKHLRENFDQFIRPVITNMPEVTGWQGVFSLIEDREGRIIMIIENTARQISQILNDVNEKTLAKAKSTAGECAEQLRALLGELHILNGNILGFSGKTGFIELTKNRNELEKEVKIMIDNRDQSVIHGHKVEIGNDNNFNGNFVIASSIQDSFNQVAKAEIEDDLKQKLDLLCTQVQDMVKVMSPEKQKEISQDLSTFVTEATKDKPRRNWYELSANGLIEAAKACAGIASPVISTVKSIITFLSVIA